MQHATSIEYFTSNIHHEMFSREGPVEVCYPSVDLVYRSVFPLVRPGWHMPPKFCSVLGLATHDDVQERGVVVLIDPGKQLMGMTDVVTFW